MNYPSPPRARVQSRYGIISVILSIPAVLLCISGIVFAALAMPDVRENTFYSLTATFLLGVGLACDIVAIGLGAVGTFQKARLRGASIAGVSISGGLLVFTGIVICGGLVVHLAPS